MSENLNVIEVTRKSALALLPERDKDSHKGDYGKALLICGSRRYIGAPYFAAQSAVNTGCGLVFLAHPESIYATLAQKLNEPILVPLPDDENGVLSEHALVGIEKELFTCDVCLVGPGIGRSAGSDAITEYLLENLQKPLVLDADALYSVFRMLDKLKRSRAKIILTPHEGEFARLSPGFTRANRIRAAREFAISYNCVLVLKGHRTVTALPDGTVYVNLSGNAGMAKGGSGDVLAGIITSLAAQGIEPAKAAYIGVWIHGAAGDFCRNTIGEYGMTPTDMLNGIKVVLKGSDLQPWQDTKSCCH